MGSTLSSCFSTEFADTSGVLSLEQRIEQMMFPLSQTQHHSQSDKFNTSESPQQLPQEETSEVRAPTTVIKPFVYDQKLHFYDNTVKSDPNLTLYAKKRLMNAFDWFKYGWDNCRRGPIGKRRNLPRYQNLGAFLKFVSGIYTREEFVQHCGKFGLQRLSSMEEPARICLEIPQCISAKCWGSESEIVRERIFEFIDIIHMDDPEHFENPE